MDTSRTRRIGLAGAVAAVALLHGAPALAADSLGDTTYTGAGSAPCGDFGGTVIQTQSASNAYAAPYDGVITSWGSRGQWPTVTFKVARNGPGGSFTVTSSDGPRTHGSPGSGQLETYPVRFPVRQGDVIGARVPVMNYRCRSSRPGDLFSVVSQDVQPGEAATAFQTEASRIPLEATIERDRDNDGYGDETQDGCPTNGSTQGPCPLPTGLGQLISPYSAGQTCNTSTRIVVDSPGVVSAAPHDGVITSWSHLSQGEVGTGTIRLKMARPLGGDSYRTIGQSAPQRPAPSRLNTYPTRIPVREGDRIGLALNGPVPCYQFTAPGTYARLDGQDLGVGAQATFYETNGALDIAAVLEADRDNDGYGDTTQDRCPTNASTRGVCPVKPPPPPVDKACEEARKKLTKAKAKLAKLKRNDAPAKKVKKAKKSVKRAKGKVGKAC